VQKRAQRVQIVRFRAPFIHRGKSAVVERFDADKDLPATGTMQQACERFLHVCAHEAAPSDHCILTKKLFRKRFQPAGAPVQERIRKCDICSAIPGVQMFDTCGGLCRSAGSEALPEHPFAAKCALVRAATRELERDCPIVVNLIFVDCHLVEAGNGQGAQLQERR
jgi:hypothetical protein